MARGGTDEHADNGTPRTEPPKEIDEQVATVKVDDEMALEEKRAKMQKELIRKKKAERRAHAKQRKQVNKVGDAPTVDGNESKSVEASVLAGPVTKPEQEQEERSVAGDCPEPAISSESDHHGHSDACRHDDGVIAAVAPATENNEDECSLEQKRAIKKKTRRHNPVVNDAYGEQNHVAQVPSPGEPGVLHCPDETPTLTPPAESRQSVDSRNTKDDETEEKAHVGHGLTTASFPSPSEDTNTNSPVSGGSAGREAYDVLPEPQRLSETNTLSVEERTESSHLTQQLAPEVSGDGVDFLRPKKMRKPRQEQTISVSSNEQAAITIQKALKRKLIKHTKRQFEKAKSFIRHSSKILAEDSNLPLVVRTPPVIPPLVFKPRAPPVSSAASSSLSSPPASRSTSHDSGGSSHSSSSGRSISSGRTLSHRSSSGSSSPSSRSSSMSSSSESSPHRLQLGQRKRRRTRHRRPRKSRGLANPSGPSADILQLPAKQPRKYGDVHQFMATRIQARMRGNHGRVVAARLADELEREIREEAMREIQEEASVRIQAHVKGFLQRRRFDLIEDADATTTTARRRSRVAPHRRHQCHHNHRHPKQNSVVPHGESSGAVSGAGENANSRHPDAVWPDEFNLEPLDGWDELNSTTPTSQPPGEEITKTHFLSKGKVRVFCGTWNLHAKKPKSDLRLWIPLNRYHIVAVGTEECVNSIAKSVLFTSKKLWETHLQEALGNEYVLVAAHSLTAIHNVVFAHESVLPYLQNIQSHAVATGLGNQLGNKGGVGISFSIGYTSFVFVNCHFDAHQQHVAKRNANFHRINQELQLIPSQYPHHHEQLLSSHSQSADLHATLTPQGLGKSITSRFSSTSVNQNAAAGSGAAAVAAVGRSSSSATSSRHERSKKMPISESFDRVFWYGDLNYRINGTRRMVDLLLLHNHHAVLRFNDQLQIEMKKGHVFRNFQEGPLNFKPTYKFDKHSNTYDSGPKQRIPSWTDRILYLAKEEVDKNKPSVDVKAIELLSYRSHMSFQTSDHRPVGAVFEVQFATTIAAPAEEKHHRADPQHPRRGSGGPGGRGVGGGSIAGVGGGDVDAFARVLAKGYKANQTRSEVCCLQ